ncbi:MAG: hypothetical protein KDK90_17770 [Leptospiraceae bacterium]|nr:hypothetical protein [Leptospiraceae bacterium]
MPNNDLPYLNLCSIHFDLGNYSVGEETCKIALELNPERAEIYQNLSQFSMIKGNLEEADNWVNKGLKIDPKLSVFYRTKGFIHYYKGQPFEAKVNFEKYLNLSPNPEPEIVKILKELKQ